jgi:hypothetical protein
MEDRVKAGGHSPFTGGADFTIMMECKPESGNCHSVYYVEQTSVAKGESNDPYQL